MTQNAARPIVVDDTDSQVRYTGQGWFQDAGSQDEFGIFGPTYNHTLHGTNSNGSFSFAFHGTSVHIYDSGNYRNLTGVLDPSCECFVDNINIGAAKPFFPGHGNNELMCEQNELTNGPHEITVNVTSKGQTFWFDYIQYTLSPGISLNTAIVLVDNTDPDIQYGPGWSGLPDIANVTNTTGSQMSFTFTGTSLTWLGLIPTEYSHKASSGTFSIDGGAPKPFPLKGLDPGNNVLTQFNEIFFATPQLVAGPHTLVVIYTGTGQQTPLTLDHMFITNTSDVQADLVPNPGSTTTPSQSSAPVPPPPDRGALPVGALIGGVIGGLALTALVIFLLWRYKRGKKDEKRPPPGIAVCPVGVTPFTPLYAEQFSTAGSRKADPGRPPWSSVSVSSKYGSTNTSSPDQSACQPQYHVQPLAPVHNQPFPFAQGGDGQSTHGPALSGDGDEVVGHNSAATGSVHRRVVHQDSGVRLHQELNVVVEDVPPDYTLN